MRDILFIGLAGGIGSMCRYGMSSAANRIFSSGFPYGTLVVNVIGCLLLGFLMQLGLTTEWIPRTVRLALTVGFLGGFTTFSTFGYETVKLLEEGAWQAVFLNIGSNVIVGVLAALAGVMLGRLVAGGA